VYVRYRKKLRMYTSPYVRLHLLAPFTGRKRGFDLPYPVVRV